MSNIYRFPGTEEMPHEIDTEEEEREFPLAARVGGVIGGILATVVGGERMILFLSMAAAHRLQSGQRAGLRWGSVWLDGVSAGSCQDRPCV